MLRQNYFVNNDGIIEGRQSQNVAKILENCRILRNEEDKYARKKETFKHYAEIPAIFVEQWMRENGLTQMDRALTEIMIQKLNTDFTHFKVTNTHETFRG